VDRLGVERGARSSIASARMSNEDDVESQHGTADVRVHAEQLDVAACAAQLTQPLGKRPCRWTYSPRQVRHDADASAGNARSSDARSFSALTV
jgi:hypothetical protein